MRAVGKATIVMVVLCWGLLGARGASAQDWSVTGAGWTKGLLSLPGGQLASLSGGAVTLWTPGEEKPGASFKVCWGEELVAAGPGQAALACREGLQVLDLKTGKTRWAARWKHPKVDGIAASADGSRVVVLAGGKVFGFSGGRLKPEAPWEVPGVERGEVAISGDGRVVVVSSPEGLWRREEGAAPVLLPGTAKASGPTLDATGGRVVVQGPASFKASLLDAQTGASLERWEVGSWLSGAVFLPDGRVGLAASVGALVGAPGGVVQKLSGGTLERVVYRVETDQLCTGDRGGELRCAALPPPPSPVPDLAAAVVVEAAPYDGPPYKGHQPSSQGAVGGGAEEPLPPGEESGGLSEEAYLISAAVLLGGATLGGVPLLVLEEDVGVGEALLLGSVAAVGMGSMVGGVMLCWLGLELMSSANELVSGASNPLTAILGAIVFIVIWPVGFVLTVGGGGLAVGGPVLTGLGMVGVDSWLGAEPQGFWTPALAAGGGGLLGAGLGFGLGAALDMEVEESIWLMVGLGTVGATLTYALVREPEGQGGTPMMVLTPPLTF